MQPFFFFLEVPDDPCVTFLFYLFTEFYICNFNAFGSFYMEALQNVNIKRIQWADLRAIPFIGCWY